MPGFIMYATAPGAEQVACFATETNALNKLPQLLVAPALNSLRDVNNLDTVNNAFLNSLGSDGYASSIVKWSVVPKRVPVAATLPR